MHAWIRDTMVAAAARHRGSEPSSWPSRSASAKCGLQSGCTSTSTSTSGAYLRLDRRERSPVTVPGPERGYLVGAPSPLAPLRSIEGYGRVGSDRDVRTDHERRRQGVRDPRRPHPDRRRVHGAARLRRRPDPTNGSIDRVRPGTRASGSRHPARHRDPRRRRHHPHHRGEPDAVQCVVAGRHRPGADRAQLRHRHRGRRRGAVAESSYGSAAPERPCAEI